VIVAALLVAGVVIWQNGQHGGSTPSASPSSSPSPAPSSSAAPTTESSTAPASTAPSPTPQPSPTTSAGPAAGSAAEVQQAIAGYYALLPGDPQTAYNSTGPTLRSVESRQDYVAFWSRFSSVTLGPISATDGSLTATAPVTYVENGVSQPEQHTFVLVRGEGGRLLIDSDRAG
jgi:hypothetical protein